MASTSLYEAREVSTLHQWIKKAWHSWLRVLLTSVAILIGICLVGIGTYLTADERYAAGIGVVGAGVTILLESFGLMASDYFEPNTVLCTTQVEIDKFMRAFISRGSSVHVASSNLSWIRNNAEMKEFFRDRVRRGNALTVFGSNLTDVREDLEAAGVIVKAYTQTNDRRPRFTFLNLGREGAEQLAVAREGLPNHWIDVYSAKHHPQVIALARAYVEQLEADS